MTTGNVNIFPDPFFAFTQSRSVKYFSHYLVYQSGANGTWDSGYRQPYAPGAWKYTAATGSTFGLASWFSNPDTTPYNIVPGDKMSFAMAVNVPNTKKVRILIQFFNTSESDLLGVAGSVDVTGDGSDVQVGKIENITVPTNAHGALLYTFMVDSTDYRILAAWAVIGATSGSLPPSEFLPNITLGRIVGLTTVSYTVAKLLTRSVDAAGTFASTSDTTPVQYYVKLATGGAAWAVATRNDLSP